MASHLSAPYFLRAQQFEFPFNSLSDVAASSILLISSTPSHVSSDQTPLPLFFPRMPPHPSFIPPMPRPAGSQASARRGRSVLPRLPVRHPHSVGLSFSSAALMAFFQPLVPLSSAFIELPPVVSLPKPVAATIPKDFIISDVHSFASSSVRILAHVVAVSDLFPSTDLQD